MKKKIHFHLQNNLQGSFSVSIPNIYIKTPCKCYIEDLICDDDTIDGEGNAISYYITCDGLGLDNVDNIVNINVSSNVLCYVKRNVISGALGIFVKNDFSRTRASEFNGNLNRITFTIRNSLSNEVIPDDQANVMFHMILEED